MTKKLEITLNKINNSAKAIKRKVTLMEVCGTHTQVISRYGIRELLPKNIKLVSGPGCPVCVTDQEDIDNIVKLAKAKVPIASYGDALRVPGFYGSLEKVRAGGASIFSVYSVEEALEIKKKYPNLVFFALGFETTAPMTVYAVENGLTIYSTHKLFLPAMEAILAMGEIKIDGFIDPGHVSVIIGEKPYHKLKVSQVITGFEREDVILGIYLLLKQIKEGRREVENEYQRVVKPEGNKKAYQSILAKFKVSDGKWRGFGVIPKSGLELKKEYKHLDAKVKYRDIIKNSKLETQNSKRNIVNNNKGLKYKQRAVCKCGEIIRGLIEPRQCPMFRKACTPEDPFGPCMVSVEGACNIEYNN